MLAAREQACQVKLTVVPVARKADPQRSACASTDLRNDWNFAIHVINSWNLSHSRINWV